MNVAIYKQISCIIFFKCESWENEGKCEAGLNDNIQIYYLSWLFKNTHIFNIKEFTARSHVIMSWFRFEIIKSMSHTL